MMKIPFTLAAVLFVAAGSIQAQSNIGIDFSKHQQDWDGFGVNYVEVRHTRDYGKWPQDYGGFRYLTKEKQDEIIEMVFGEDGLKPGILKLFLDPYHEQTPDNDDPDVINMEGFDHKTTTGHMRYFAQEGLTKTRAQGSDLTVIAGLYAAPGWSIKQGVWGRDLIPEQKYELGEYMISWVKYLQDVEKIPVKYLSLSNEEEDYGSWAKDGTCRQYTNGRSDRALWWPKEQTVAFLKFMRKKLDQQGLQGVGLTPGECAKWNLFKSEGIADAIAKDKQALDNLGLITSHNFGVPANPAGIKAVREKRPELHAWTTSSMWGAKNKTDIRYLDYLYGLIYGLKSNGLIPWAISICQWESERAMDGSVAGNSNNNCPFWIDRDTKEYEVKRIYYYFKQVCCAGQPGMKVIHAEGENKEMKIIAFAKNGTIHSDNFLVINLGSKGNTVDLRLSGTTAKKYDAYRTSDGGDDYVDAGSFEGMNFSYEAPPESVTTFFGDNAERGVQKMEKK